MLGEAEEAMHMAVNLTNQLLTFSKGGKPLRKTIYPLPIIEYAAKFVLSGSKIEYDLNLGGDLWQIIADGDQISRVIQNIVLNGDQSMDGEGKMSLEARNVMLSGKKIPVDLPAGAYVEVAISDGGSGIPGERREGARGACSYTPPGTAP